MRESSKFIIISMHIIPERLLSFAEERGPNEPELGRALFVGIIILSSSLDEIKRRIFGPHGRSATVDYYHYYCAALTKTFTR